MKKLIFLIPLIVSCMQKPADCPKPEAAKAFCMAIETTPRHTVIQCDFHNETPVDSNFCYNMSVARNWHDKPLYTEQVCPGNVPAKQVKSVKIDMKYRTHDKLSNNCGRKLQACVVEVNEDLGE